MRRALAERLERGAWSGPTPALAAALWSRLADPVRHVDLPPCTTVVGVGGATLGGSCKTPVVAELTAALRAAERAVAVVAHGYRGRLGRPRQVEADDAVWRVGDDALLLARSLAKVGVPVFVGQDRTETAAEAARHAPYVVIDSLLQARPVRLGLSILVLDGDRPWGSGRCPPAGDLRATPDRLQTAADVILAWRGADVGAARRPVERFDSDVVGARDPRGNRVPLESLRRLRCGVALAVARPSRILSALARVGVRPVAVRLFPDHAVPSGGRREPVDVWLTSSKCATKLDERLAGRPLLVIDHRVRLPASLLGRVPGARAIPSAEAVVESAPCRSTVVP